MKEKIIMFTGGGTAGHVMVNLALIPYFEENNWQIDYIGSKEGIEKELIENNPYVTYHQISTGKLRRYQSIENFKDPFRVLKGIFQAFKIMGKTKPQIIFSKGGFVSVPVVIASWLRRIPTIIHESDLTPGLANKIAIRFSNQVLTTFEETESYLPKHKTTYIGAVVRDEIFTGEKEKGYQLLLNSSNKAVLLVMGGSIGSQNLNRLIRDNLKALLDNFQIIHICGKDNIDKNFDVEGYTQFEYLNEDLKDVYAITDFVLSRAGANAIFEFLALQIPMLLIPLSRQASRGDQIDNAKSFTAKGYAKMLEEEQLTSESLLTNLSNLKIEKTEIQEKMSAYSSAQAKQHVIDLIEQIKK